MMNIQTIKATMNGLVSKYGEEEAIERFLEKYPDEEGSLELLMTGELELDESMKYTAPEDELPEVEDKAEIIAETVTEVKAEEPKAEKPKKEKKAKVVKEKTEKVNKGPSKAELARQIYANAEDKSRSAVTKIFMEQLGLTAAGSSTYMQNCKKWFESTQK